MPVSLLVAPLGDEVLPEAEPVPDELGEDEVPLVPLPMVVLPLTEPEAEPLVLPGVEELLADEGDDVSVEEPVVVDGEVVAEVDEDGVVVVVLVVELVPDDLSRSQPVTAAEARARAATRGRILFMGTPIRTGWCETAKTLHGTCHASAR